MDDPDQKLETCSHVPLVYFPVYFHLPFQGSMGENLLHTCVADFVADEDVVGVLPIADLNEPK